MCGAGSHSPLMTGGPTSLRGSAALLQSALNTAELAPPALVQWRDGKHPARAEQSWALWGGPVPAGSHLCAGAEQAPRCRWTLCGWIRPEV